MNNIGQYYEILGLKPGVSLAEIKQAYRGLAMVWHPDRYPNNPQLQQKACEEIKLINEAYNILKADQISESSLVVKTNASTIVETEAYYNVLIFSWLLSWLIAVTLHSN